MPKDDANFNFDVVKWKADKAGWKLDYADFYFELDVSKHFDVAMKWW